MLYREMGKTGDKLSILGFGCMRYPQKNGRIDEERTERQIIQAIEQGVNYFDTAYVYHAGKSETILGKVLSKGYRDRVKIATKLPPYLVHSQKDMDSILENQLRKLQTDRIDYYLVHALNDIAGWNRLKELGIVEFFAKAKKDGRLVYVGFSYHGDKEDFKKIVDDYPWDFCQIQYNYIDENVQAGKEGLEYAASKGLGVIIMEPLRGGSLVGRMPEEIKKIWSSASVQRTPAEWALRWIWNHPQAAVVLSGMNEESHIEENIRIAGEAYAGSLTDEELMLYGKVKQEYSRLMRVGCTGCGYCMPCPAGVDIPLCFNYYNSKHLFKEKHSNFQYMAFTSGLSGGKPSNASLCINCGKCEKACPQHIEIRQKLKELSKDMEKPVMKPVLWILRKYLAIRNKLARRKT
ncbi:MAG: aldo/keto reductase [Clostridia bacterium]|nr:aldo/keto reductase [Clostridia bacterium]